MRKKVFCLWFLALILMLNVTSVVGAVGSSQVSVKSINEGGAISKEGINQEETKQLERVPPNEETATVSENVYNKKMEFDLLNISNVLETLSKEAYNQRKHDLFEGIINSNYSLLRKNIDFHKKNDYESINSLLIEYKKSVKTFGKELSYDFNDDFGLKSPPPSLVNPDQSVAIQSQTPILNIGTTPIVDTSKDTLWSFTPPSNGTYQFIVTSALSPSPSISENLDIDFFIWDKSYLDVTKNYKSGQIIATVNLEKNKTYNLEIIANMLDQRVWITAVKNPTLDLNSFIDIELPLNQSAVYKFTPDSSAMYEFSIARFGGFGYDITGYYMAVYADENLTQLVVDDSTDVFFNAQAGKTYFMKLEAVEQPLTARIQVYSWDQAVLVPDIPRNVFKDIDTTVFEFSPKSTGEYLFSTDFYRGEQTSHYPPYTSVGIYDERFIEFYGGGSGGATVQLKAGRVYYVKIKDYSGKSDFSINVSLNKKGISENTPYDLLEPQGITEYVKYTPKTASNFVLWTSPYEGGNSTNDTIINVYADSNYSVLLATNDNYNNTTFSRVDMKMDAGISYYIGIKSYQSLSARFMVSTLSDAITPTNLVFNALSVSNFELTWSAPRANSHIIKYEIYNGNELFATVPNGQLGYVYTGTEDATGYSLSVRAIDASANKSEFSNSVVIIYSNSYSTPSNLKAKTETSTSIILKWETEKDKFVTGYEIYNKSTLIGSISKDRKNYIITGLSPNQVLRLSVKAVIPGKNSIISTTINVVSPGTKLRYNYVLGRLQSISVEATKEIIQSFAYDDNGNLKQSILSV